MPTTRISFLKCLVHGDESSWREFDAVYKPLLRHWLYDKALSHNDVEDLIQEVMLFVAQQLPTFEHNTRVGAFRKWLRLITVNTARNYLRKNQIFAANATPLQDLLIELEDADSSVSLAFEQDYQRMLLHQLLRRAAKAFAPETMSIFHQYVIEGADVETTAATHQVSKAAVYIAKSRVLKQLREDCAEQFGVFDE
jgi:RNA polymerase sigma-70 factor (ECF subfamily)